MRGALAFIFVAGLVAVLLAGAGSAAAARGATDEYIVVLKSGVDVQSVVAQHTSAANAKVFLTYEHALNGYAARLTRAGVAAVRRDPRVQYVVKDRPLELAAQATPTGVRRIGAQAVHRSNLVKLLKRTTLGVAVVDTGVDLDHPDLGTVVPGRNCVSPTRTADDDNGHGTHVAGTIAALDDKRGVVGVAPDVTLYAVKIFDGRGNGSFSSAICGIDWVAANAALVRVANLSFAGRGYTTPSTETCLNGNNDPLHTAICRATKLNVTFVVAAGNDKKDALGYIPAAYEEVIAVSALSDSDGAPGGLGGPPSCRPNEGDDVFASFSNFGSVVDIAAPGVCIYSTYANGGYATLSGTSMAAPHVAGAAALYIQSHPLASPAEVRAALLASQEPGPVAGDPDPGEGVVHVNAGWASDLPTLPGLPGLPDVSIPPLPPLPPIPTLP